MPHGVRNSPEPALTDTYFGGKIPVLFFFFFGIRTSFRLIPAVHWTYPSDLARVNINAYGLLESETDSTSTVVSACVTKCACKWSSIYRYFFRDLRIWTTSRCPLFFTTGINLRNPKVYLCLLNLSLGVSGVA